MVCMSEKKEKMMDKKPKVKAKTKKMDAIKKFKKVSPYKRGVKR